MLAVKGAVAAVAVTCASGDTARAAGGATCARGGVRVRMVLVLLQVMLVMLVMMVMGVMPVATGRPLATGAGQFLLAVYASGQQHDRTVGPLLQGVVLHRDRIAVVVPEVLKDVTVQVHVLLADLLLLGQDGFALTQQPLLTVLHLLDLVG